ncbi:MAG: DUF3267 domain-containing protein [Thermomicrobiaceae bacterium]
MTSEIPEDSRDEEVNSANVEEFKPSLAISIVWNVLGTILVFVGLLLFSLIYGEIGDGSLAGSSYVESTGEEDEFTVTVGLGGMLPVVILIVGVLLAHEAIHGVAFWWYGGRPKFGAALVQKILPVLYCTAPGYRFTRSQFSVIVLAPLVLISMAGIVMMPFVGYGALLVVPLALNFAGAIGDIWMFGMLMVRPANVMIEDLKDGLRFHYPATSVR